MSLERKEKVACMNAQIHILDSLNGLYSYKRHILMPLELETLILILHDAHLNKENLFICYPCLSNFRHSSKTHGKIMKCLKYTNILD